ncbi:MAG: MBOAT family protein [Spirochaetaceae bacterium]|jgi:D-alanyl-lipoteichoic acid acyltransferase DltB (MBOAT superfamily)|nr:MBOAT family protein [Spirochaetaceae bacterium]
MNFNSWQYLVFFPVIFILYYAVTAKNRRHSNRISQIILLAASFFFYACWNPAYLFLILLSVLVTWVSGLVMEGKTQRQKRLVLTFSLIINLGILFFFKYYNFFAATFGGLTPFQMPAFNVLLPVGISFYTFQALGYSIDVYRGTVKTERDFINYALFVTFFPQLVAGPIERTANLLPQFKVNHRFDYERVTSGLKLAAWGMFKKVAVADKAAVYVNAVYGDPASYPAASLLLATFFFAVQIYCDFSGYSDIAIGCARALGFDLMRNFRSPYFARSITDFWRRWHISLTTWLTDYLYIPLGGSRKGFGRQCINILIVFTVSGLWHGAAWHFVAWGILCGAFQIAERCVQRYGNKFVNTYRFSAEHKQKNNAVALFQILITFVFVCFAWVFFRANSVFDAFVVFRKLVSLPFELAQYAAQLPQNGIIGTVRLMFQLGAEVANPIAGFGITALAFSWASIIVLGVVEVLTRKTDGTIQIMKAPLIARWALYYGLILVIVSGFSQTSVQFIYFTF